MRASAADALRLAGRAGVLAVAGSALALVGIQFEGIVAKNVAMASDLGVSRAEIAALQRRVLEQRRTLRRLASAEGAVPEIHAKLRLVGPHEDLIFVRGLEPAQAPSPAAVGE